MSATTASVIASASKAPDQRSGFGIEAETKSARPLSPGRSPPVNLSVMASVVPIALSGVSSSLRSPQTHVRCRRELVTQRSRAVHEHRGVVIRRARAVEQVQIRRRRQHAGGERAPLYWTMIRQSGSGVDVAPAAAAASSMLGISFRRRRTSPVACAASAAVRTRFKAAAVSTS